MNESTPGKRSPYNWLKTVLKIAVTIACLLYVFNKIDLEQTWKAMGKANIFWLLAAFLAYTLSKWMASLRLNIYFRNIGIRLPSWQNIKLFWLGMFYNLFLPGAITGDAYKVILLSKRYKVSYKKTTAAVLLDRITGLISLGFIVAFYSLWVLDKPWMPWLLVSGSLLLVPFLYFAIRRFFPDFLPGFWSTLLLGTGVQLLVLASFYCVIFSLGITDDLNSYVFIFMVAVIVSVLPVSVGGGLGIREFAMVEGTRYLGMGSEEQHTAILLSLLFYTITVTCSLIGAIFVFKNPLDKTTSAA